MCSLRLSKSAWDSSKISTLCYRLSVLLFSRKPPSLACFSNPNTIWKCLMILNSYNYWTSNRTLLISNFKSQKKQSPKTTSQAQSSKYKVQSSKFKVQRTKFKVQRTKFKYPMRFVFTKFFYLLIAASLILLSLSWGRPLLRWVVVAYDIALIILAIIDARRSQLPKGVRITREFSGRFAVGAETSVSINVQNAQPRAISLVVKDEYPPQMRLSG